MNMIPSASTTAWALHDLGLATSFGGTVFGKLALHPAVSSISSQTERGEVIRSAWRRFSLVNLLSHAVFATTWLVGRKMLTGREVDRTTHALVLAKDVLVATSVATGVASIIAGDKGYREPTGEAPPVGFEGEVLPSASNQAKVAEKIASTAGLVNLLAIGGILGITAVLAMKAGSSPRFSLLSRLLP